MNASLRLQPESVGMTVRPMLSGDAARWDAFVQDCPEATFFHRAGWAEVIKRAFGHRTHFLLAEVDGEIHGVLPLAEINSRLFGHSLSALPFCVYGGPAASSPEAKRALDQAAQRLAIELGVEHLEYRNLQPFHMDWPGKDLYVTFRKEIDPEVEHNLNAHPAQATCDGTQGYQSRTGERDRHGHSALLPRLFQ